MKLRKIAPEYYDEMPCHVSWARVLWDFVWRVDMGPYARVHREYVNTHEYAQLNRQRQQAANGKSVEASKPSIANSLLSNAASSVAESAKEK